LFLKIVPPSVHSAKMKLKHLLYLYGIDIIYLDNSLEEVCMYVFSVYCFSIHSLLSVCLFVSDLHFYLCICMYVGFWTTSGYVPWMFTRWF
jgi:hypothetical protein